MRQPSDPAQSPQELEAMLAQALAGRPAPVR